MANSTIFPRTVGLVLVLVAILYLLLAFRFGSPSPTELVRFVLGTTMSIDSVEIRRMVMRPSEQLHVTGYLPCDSCYRFSTTIFGHNNVSAGLRIDSILFVDSDFHDVICRTQLYFNHPLYGITEVKGINGYEQVQISPQFHLSPDYRALYSAIDSSFKARKIQFLMYSSRGIDRIIPTRYLAMSMYFQVTEDVLR
jgi:hypothetical protein